MSSLGRRFAGLLASAVLLAGLPALAHKASDAYLTLEQQGGGATFSGRWEIALRDLEPAVGLDDDGNGEITWGELRRRHEAIAAYATARLVVTADGAPCRLTTGAQQVQDHGDGAYTVLPFDLACPAPPRTLAVEYHLFADTDPLHRGLLNLRLGGATRSAVLDPQAPAQSFELAEQGRWRQLGDYLAQGVWHIWIGIDHVLFLLSLLLPAVLVVRAGRWQPVERFAPAFWDVLKIVTAFTAAHSITLTLATLGLVTLPSRPVEAAIAASVVLAALNNLWPLPHVRRWWVAFGFGLIHGFGFAGALAELGLPRDALALSLFGFNAGVEVGQLAIVAIFLPLAYALRAGDFYRRGVRVGGSLSIAALAAVWFVERAFDVKLLGL